MQRPVVLLVIFCFAWSANAFIRYTKLRTVRYDGAGDPGDALYLTDYIKKGQIAEGTAA